MRRILFFSGAFFLAATIFALAALKEGKTIPSFQTTLLDGRKVVVQNDKGKLSVQIKGSKVNQNLAFKVLVLKFWATWCRPCQITGQWLKKLHQTQNQKGVLILAVSIDEDGRASVEPFVKENKTPYLVALDPKAEVADQFKVEALPTIFVIDKKGTIVKVFVGMPSGLKELQEAFRSAGVR
ncbi:MAG: TlpA family protein disulfide reductase [Armatimonadetes bacterium]|nr:TlpA family protein disulfide reductase [Armatimonadota bacterium]